MNPGYATKSSHPQHLTITRFAVKNSFTYNRHSLLEHPNYKELTRDTPFFVRGFRAFRG